MATNSIIHIFLIISLNIWLTHGSPIVYHEINMLTLRNETAQCQHMMTLEQIQTLLKQQPCAAIVGKENRKIMKRNTDAGNVDIHALQTTINDHRTMINYLINNSINATFVSDAIGTHHSKTGPILSSWRDLIDIFSVVFFIGFLIYYCLFRTGFTACDKLLSACCNQTITRLHKQKQGEHQQHATIMKKPSQKAHHRRPHSSIATVEDDIVQIHNGYMSE